MLGTVDPQQRLLDAEQVCGHLVPAGSFHRALAELGDRLFRDEDFSDLYDAARGRRSVPPSLVAKVLLLASLEGLSDREALDRVRCDLRWKVALRLPLQDEGFHPTVLCYFRERLRRSEAPRRIFERFREIATEAGLLRRGGVRVLDSTPVLSAVQTQDTVQMIRGAVRGVLRAATPEQHRIITAALWRDDYDQRGKPAIAWDDPGAREALVDELVRDATAVLEVLEDLVLSDELVEAADLLATVSGQDVERGEDGRFHIRRGVARSRVISVVDPEVRHGRKSVHGFYNGYKAHVACDPETELISEVAVTPANVHDSEAVADLLPEIINADEADPTEPALTVVADSAYGPGAVRQMLDAFEVEMVIKARPEPHVPGRFPKSAFRLDMERGIAICPAGVTTTHILRRADGSGFFRFPKKACASCELRPRCTVEKARRVAFGPHDQLLVQARALSKTREFLAIYNAKRPTVERVISRLVRRGGRKARYRGRGKVEAQLTLKAAAENLLRMLRIGLGWTEQTGWAIA